MHLTCQSEYGKLKIVFIKKVQGAFISQYVLSQQWKDLNFLNEPDFEIAMEEYLEFQKLLQTNGIELKFFEKDNSVTLDSVYCRDSSIATDKGMILCAMGK